MPCQLRQAPPVISFFVRVRAMLPHRSSFGPGTAVPRRQSSRTWMLLWQPLAQQPSTPLSQSKYRQSPSAELVSPSVETRIDIDIVIDMIFTARERECVCGRNSRYTEYGTAGRAVVLIHGCEKEEFYGGVFLLEEFYQHNRDLNGIQVDDNTLISARIFTA